MPASRITSNSPWHVIMVMDDSNSMAGKPSEDLNLALEAMLTESSLHMAPSLTFG